MAVSYDETLTDADGKQILPGLPQSEHFHDELKSFLSLELPSSVARTYLRNILGWPSPVQGVLFLQGQLPLPPALPRLQLLVFSGVCSQYGWDMRVLPQGWCSQILPTAGGRKFLKGQGW